MSSADPQYPGPQDSGLRYPEAPSLPPYLGVGAMPPEYGQTQPHDESTRNQALAVLVAHIAMTLFCCSPLAVAGIVVATQAMSRATVYPESARSLVRWGWGLAIANVVLVIVLVVSYLVLLVSNPDFG